MRRRSHIVYSLYGLTGIFLILLLVNPESEKTTFSRNPVRANVYIDPSYSIYRVKQDIFETLKNFKTSTDIVYSFYTFGPGIKSIPTKELNKIEFLILESHYKFIMPTTM